MFKFFRLVRISIHLIFSFEFEPPLEEALIFTIGLALLFGIYDFPNSHRFTQMCKDPPRKMYFGVMRHSYMNIGFSPRVSGEGGGLRVQKVLY